MFKKLFKAEGGFTLVELLVTIAILAVLFGITTLTLSGIGSDAQDTVCEAEYHVVQSAIDIYMAANPDATLAAGSDTTVGPLTAGFGQYLRSDSVGEYTWTTAGALTAGDCPATP